MSVAGLKPLEPGFQRVEIRPQLGDLESLALTAHTIQGPIRVQSQGKSGGRTFEIKLPAGCAGELVVSSQERVDLERMAESAPGLARYRLPSGTSVPLDLIRT